VRSACRSSERKGGKKERRKSLLGAAVKRRRLFGRVGRREEANRLAARLMCDTSTGVHDPIFSPSMEKGKKGEEKKSERIPYPLAWWCSKGVPRFAVADARRSRKEERGSQRMRNSRSHILINRRHDQVGRTPRDRKGEKEGGSRTCRRPLFREFLLCHRSSARPGGGEEGWPLVARLLINTLSSRSKIRKKKKGKRNFALVISIPQVSAYLPKARDRKKKKTAIPPAHRPSIRKPASFLSGRPVSTSWQRRRGEKKRGKKKKGEEEGARLLLITLRRSRGACLLRYWLAGRVGEKEEKKKREKRTTAYASSAVFSKEIPARSRGREEGRKKK